MIVVRNPSAMVAACERKTRYESEKAARVTGRTVLRENADKPPRLWPYPCLHCMGWHLTKSATNGTSAITSNHMWEGIA